MSFGAGQPEVADMASVLHIFTLGRKTVGAEGVGGDTEQRTLQRCERGD